MLPVNTIIRIAILLLVAVAGLVPLHAADFYVAPLGTPWSPGTISSPWDLQTALSQPAAVKPGDTIWLRGGLYYGVFTSSLTGTSTSPIVLRQYPGERATVDGPASAAAILTINGAWAWYWGFEVTCSDPNRNIIRATAFQIFGANTRMINVVAHDTGQGMSFWQPATDSSIYGSIAYNNGYELPDRGHGHGIYTQNDTGVKHILDNILFQSFGLGIQAYTDTGSLNNFDIQGNAIFNNGVVSHTGGQYNLLLGGAPVAQNANLINDYTYYSPSSAPLGSNSLGYGSGCNNLSLTNSYFAAPGALQLNCTNITMTGNVFVGAVSIAGQPTGSANSQFPANIYVSGPPTGLNVFVRPNQYEPNRANIIVYNWDKLPSVSADVSSILTVGQAYEVRDSQNFYGAPVVSGTYTGQPISIPMGSTQVAATVGVFPVPPVHTSSEFNVFVLLPQSAAGTFLPNNAPQVSPGPSQSITLPVTTVALNGSITDDGLPNHTLTATWSQISGPAAVTFTTADAPQTTATFTEAGVYVLQLAATDGDLSTVSQVTITVHAVGANPPQISQVTASPVWSVGATISWNTSALSTSEVSYGISPGLSLRSGVNPTLMSSHAVTLDGLAPSTTYSYQVKSADSLGNLAISPIFTFSTPAAPAGGGATASFAKVDTATQGNWKGAYGSDGAVVINDSSTIPPYANVLVSGQAAYTWADPTPDTRALLHLNSTQRIAATWYSLTNVALDINLTDGNAHQFALYCLDWDSAGPRQERVDVYDAASNTLLDSRTLSSFAQGAYVVWNLKGHVIIRVVRSAGANAVISGLFFGPPVAIPVNQAPVVSAGPNQAIASLSAFALSGSASDDGLPLNTLTVFWSQVSGPGVATFSSPGALQSIATVSAPGVYVLQLTASDGALTATSQVTIAVGTALPSNQPPSVSAGANQTVTFPAGVALTGVATDDGLPNNTLTITWSKVSGPGTVTFSPPNSTQTSATFSTAGVYVLQLLVSDGAASASSQVTITVNQSPIVNAGLAQTITIPAAVSLSGSVSDDGLPNNTLTIVWSKLSGPGTVTFGSSSSSQTTATFSTSGVYILQLSVNDGAATTSSQVTITANRAPVVSAGADQSIVLPASATLNGTATDDGLPGNSLTTTWSKVSGPGTVTFGSPGTLQTTATFASAGSYVLQLSANDGAASASSTLAVTVTNPPTPVISQVVVSSITLSGATVSWVTNVPSTSEVAFGTSNSLGSSSGIDPVLVTSHSVVLNTLSSGTTYFYQVKSVNGVGVPGASAVLSFTTGTGTAAQFIAVDNTTRGNWQGVYGFDGAVVVNDATVLPAYALVAATGQLAYTWASAPSASSALARLSGPGRIAATWYSTTSFSVDMNFTDGKAHRVAVYCLDWDGVNTRSQKLEILDAVSKVVLDTRNATTFSNGVYFVWNLTGHIILRATQAAGANAVISGIFWGPGSAPVNQAPVVSAGANQSITLPAGQTSAAPPPTMGFPTTR